MCSVVGFKVLYGGRGVDSSTEEIESVNDREGESPMHWRRNSTSWSLRCCSILKPLVAINGTYRAKASVKPEVDEVDHSQQFRNSVSMALNSTSCSSF